MFKNLVGFALEDKYRGFELPRYFTLGVSRRTGSLTMAFDSEYIWGQFGGRDQKTVDIWMLRAGVEKRFYSWLAGRMGLIYPVIARTSTLGDLRDDIPSPKLGPTLGLSFYCDDWQMDFSLHADPAMSYIEQKGAVAAMLSLLYSF